MNSETSAQLKIKVMNISKRELFKDLDEAVEFDQSQIFKKIYENEFGTPGGEPYGALIGDYEFTNHPEDVDLLSKMSNVAAAAFCPFITAASPEPVRLRELHRAVEAARPGEDLRHGRVHQVEIVPRLGRFAVRDAGHAADAGRGCPTARKPSRSTSSTSRRSTWTTRASRRRCPTTSTAWMNAAYVMGARLTDAFAKYGFCTAIRGAEGGGKVEGLPAHVFTSDDGDTDLKCPTEIGITDRREAELSKLGFLPLCHYKNTDYSVFFGAQTTQKPKKYDRPEATANAAISARLPYIMASLAVRPLPEGDRPRQDRLVHGSRGLPGLAGALDRQLRQRRSEAEPGGQGPLSAAGGQGRGQRDPRAPGSYNAVAWLRPWLQMEELTASLRMVARIPQLQK